MHFEEQHVHFEEQHVHFEEQHADFRMSTCILGAHTSSSMHARVGFSEPRIEFLEVHTLPSVTALAAHATGLSPQPAHARRDGALAAHVTRGSRSPHTRRGSPARRTRDGALAAHATGVKIKQMSRYVWSQYV